MKKLLLWLVKVCVAGAAAIAALSLFALFYSYSGVHSPNPTGSTDYTWQPYQYHAQRTEGSSAYRADYNGFNNLNRTLDRPVDILLMGDSNMEANSVAQTDGTGAMLNQLCPEKYTYNIATSAHYLYTCVKNLENAVKEYAPTTCVIMDTSAVDLDAASMQQVLDGEYATIPSYDQGLLALLQKWVPGIKMLYKQLSDWVEIGSAQQDAPADDGAEDISASDYERILSAFLGKAENAVGGGNRLLIVYIPRMSIAEAGDVVFETDPDKLSVFSQTCDRYGIIFVDMTEEFEQLYVQQHKLPYGFPNSRVGSGHLNKDGHRVIAEKLAGILADMG